MSTMHNRKGPGLGLAVALLALGCGGTTAPEQAGGQQLASTEGTSYRDAYARYAEDVRDGLASGRCRQDQKCGALAFINCGIEVDRPGYYVDTRNGQVLEVCGGACRARREGFCVACPPPEWTCGR